MSAKSFPLDWPTTFPRTKWRAPGKFKTTLASALTNVETSLRRFGSDSGKKIENLVMSSNVTLGVQRPSDPGVAVWFVWDGLQVCIPVDRYDKVETNLQAIHHIIEARRVELRHGTLALVRATFTGFKALPAPPGGTWREVLGVGKFDDLENARGRYRELASENHPDKGGSHARMSEINKAWEQAQSELKGP